eukprot:5816640-Pyramimonas_sp.AAC.1
MEDQRQQAHAQMGFREGDCQPHAGPHAGLGPALGLSPPYQRGDASGGGMATVHPGIVGAPLAGRRAGGPVAMDAPLFPECYHMISGAPRQSTGYLRSCFARQGVDQFHRGIIDRPYVVNGRLVEAPHYAHMLPPHDPATEVAPPGIHVPVPEGRPLPGYLGDIHRTQQANMAVWALRQERWRRHEPAATTRQAATPLQATPTTPARGRDMITNPEPLVEGETVLDRQRRTRPEAATPLMLDISMATCAL